MPTTQTRAAAITAPQLAPALVKAVKAKKVVDLSVLNARHLPVHWGGAGVGNYAFPFMQVKEVIDYDGPAAQYWVGTQIMDSRTGTHITPPAHYGLPHGFTINQYQGDIRTWAQQFEKDFGKIQSTNMTSDRVPVSQMVGPARVINVQDLVGTTDPGTWPAAPAILPAHIQTYENMHGDIEGGEVVIFHTGHTDAHFLAPKRGRMEMVMKAPLDGASEGWPSPTPETIRYLAERGVRHVAIDAPSMGSVDPKAAAMTHWAAANAGMIFTEFLINVGALPAKGAFYIFLNPKIENNHGGPGRAIAILPHG
jgi:kynurenine formamidase